MLVASIYLTEPGRQKVGKELCIYLEHGAYKYRLMGINSGTSWNLNTLQLGEAPLPRFACADPEADVIEAASMIESGSVYGVNEISINPLRPWEDCPVCGHRIAS